MAQLFDPQVAIQSLASAPNLQRALCDPHVEGARSVSFPHARKTDRQIYRVLANKHYPHLGRLLRAVEYCLGKGFTQPTLMKTRAAKPFAEVIAEVFAAEHFLLEGYSVRGFDTTKQQDSVPDLLIKGKGFEVAVEVYSPRVWEGLQLMVDRVSESLMNADKPRDYRYSGAIEAEYRSLGRRHAIPDPFSLSDALLTIDAERFLEEFWAKLDRALDNSLTALTATLAANDLHVTISVELRSIVPSTGRTPSRGGAIHGPTKTGFDPEGMFARLVEKGVKKKVLRGQATGHAPLRMLLVDLSLSELTSELGNDYYRRGFQAVLESAFPEGLYGYDAIAFVDSPAWSERLRMHYLVAEASSTQDYVSRFFPNSPV